MLLVIHGVSGVDEAAARKLAVLVRKLRAGGFAVSFSEAKDEVLTVFQRTDIASMVGEESMYPTQATAILSPGSMREPIPALRKRIVRWSRWHAPD